eukprot:tig00020724_g13416.t1
MGAGSSARSRYPAAEIVGEVEVTPPPKKGPGLRPRAPARPDAPARRGPLPHPLPPAPPVLYAFEACPECARLELSLRHCKIRYERREEEPLELRLPWYVVTTERPVPRLHHGRHVLEDLPSILQHIEKLPGAAALLPIDFEARARVRVFLLSASNRLTALLASEIGAALGELAAQADPMGAPLFAFLPSAADFCLLPLVWELRAALAAAGAASALPPRLQAWLPPPRPPPPWASASRPRGPCFSSPPPASRGPAPRPAAPRPLAAPLVHTLTLLLQPNAIHSTQALEL